MRISWLVVGGELSNQLLPVYQFPVEGFDQMSVCARDKEGRSARIKIALTQQASEGIFMAVSISATGDCSQVARKVEKPPKDSRDDL